MFGVREFAQKASSLSAWFLRAPHEMRMPVPILCVQSWGLGSPRVQKSCNALRAVAGWEQ